MTIYCGKTLFQGITRMINFSNVWMELKELISLLLTYPEVNPDLANKSKSVSDLGLYI